MKRKDTNRDVGKIDSDCPYRNHIYTDDMSCGPYSGGCNKGRSPGENDIICWLDEPAEEG